MTETFKPVSMWCDLGQGHADIHISEDGSRGYASEVCAECYLYTDMELARAEGTSFEKDKAVERLVQTIRSTPSRPVIIECLPPVKEVADAIYPPEVRAMSEIISRALQRAATLPKSEGENG